MIKFKSFTDAIILNNNDMEDDSIDNTIEHKLP